MADELERPPNPANPKFFVVCCGKGYNAMVALCKHYTRAHPNETLTLERVDQLKQELLVCSVCGKGFASQERLDSHKSRKHSKDNGDMNPEENIHDQPPRLERMDLPLQHEVVVCNVCGKEFSSQKRLDHHKSKMHKEDPVIPKENVAEEVPEAPRGKKRSKKSTDDVISQPTTAKKHSKESLTIPGENAAEAVRRSPRGKKRSKESTEGDDAQSTTAKKQSRGSIPIPEESVDVVPVPLNDKSEPELSTSAARGIRPDPPKQACTMCPEVFPYKTKTDKKKFQEHMEIHQCLRPYVCPYCQAAFVSDIRLLSHVSIHNGDSNFDCPTCDEKFKNKKEMTSHARNCRRS